MEPMRLRKIIVTSLVFFFGTASLVFSEPPGEQYFKTSFDCTKVTSDVEKTTCHDKQLADADMELSSLYRTLIANLPEREIAQLKREQLDWIKLRNGSCSGSKIIADCLHDAYRKRIEVLKKRGKALPASPPQTDSGYSIKWFKGFDLELYVRGEKPPETMADIQRLFQSTWEDGFEAEGEKEKRDVRSCRQFFSAKKDNLYPQANIDRGPYSAVGLYCIAAQLIIDAKPAHKSFIENLKLDGSIGKYIPADAEYIISDEQPRHTKGNWADVEKLKYVKMFKDKEILFSSQDADHSVRPIAVGDFNNDGVQDILLLISHSVKEGTHFEKYLYLLTRFGPDDVLKTLNRYAALED